MQFLEHPENKLRPIQTHLQPGKELDSQKPGQIATKGPNLATVRHSTQEIKVIALLAPFNPQKLTPISRVALRIIYLEQPPRIRKHRFYDQPSVHLAAG